MPTYHYGKHTNSPVVFFEINLLCIGSEKKQDNLCCQHLFAYAYNIYFITLTNFFIKLQHNLLNTIFL